MANPLNIAIVGVGGMLPGSADLEGFWRNIVTARDASRDVPTGRWPINSADVLRPGGPAADKVYSLRGYYLDSVPRDAAIDPALDPLFHLALAVCRSAWSNTVTRGLDRRRIGVVLGSIALPTERISQLSREIFGQKTPLTVDPRNVEVVGRPAALVAEALGLGGLNLTLDAACASSLYAIKIACDELTSGRADAMLAGGLNRSDSLYTQMGFSQLRALSPTSRCSPLDARADGLLVGEGGVAFVLKRLSDAIAAGDRVHGVIQGIGLSNDVGGGLLAPASEGQLRAMRGAYEQADWRPSDVDLIECHATGTPVGDAVELASLRSLWTNERGGCALSAVKSNVGHLLTGAAAAGVLKVLLALEHETLPPTANFQSSAGALGPFEVLSAPRQWSKRNAETPRRAAVDAFGFGGVNGHLLIEEPPRNSEVKSAIPNAQSSMPIAVVGIGAHFGPWTDGEAFSRRLSGEDRRAIEAWCVDQVTLPLDRIRTPPSELHACLAQQLLLLRVAAEAIDDAGGLENPRVTGAVIGIALDPNTANFDFRWSRPEPLRDSAGPPLTADRVMGHLGSVAASRLARAFDLGGPSFTVSAGEASGLVALKLAVEALRRGETSAAVIGAVDLPNDPRTALLHAGPCCDGAAALVLMPLAAAEMSGRPVYAVLNEEQGLGPVLAVDAAEDIGDAGATAAMASLVKACLVVNRDRCEAMVRCSELTARFKPSRQPIRQRRARSPIGRTLTISAPHMSVPATRQEYEAPAASGDVAAMQTAAAEAHETFLRFTEQTYRSIAKTLDLQHAMLERLVKGGGLVALDRRRKKVFLDRAQCLEFATGKIGSVLGPEFGEIDRFPTRVRLPDEPLMLVDRVISIEGERRSLSHGRIVTEHDVTADRWYLDNGVAPASIAIESGQADLMLSAWLGVDFHTRGRAVYRLLDAAVTFHRELPRVGETVRYDIRIKHFFRQGETLLFRFEFDGTIDGKPLLTMRDGCAGFFTAAELASGQGVVRPTRFRRERVAIEAPRLSAGGFDVPGTGKLRLIHRVTHFDPHGGDYGLGVIRTEADIHPDDWFLTCHFVDDQVMPGTLMYECCLHTLRMAMQRMGWRSDGAEATFQPVLGVTSRLKCRGQVTAATKTVAYEVSIKEIRGASEPMVIADALMYADGKAIVDVQNMTLRLSVSPADEALRIRREATTDSQSLIRRRNTALFTGEQVLEFATGSPSRAFGEKYAPFDHDRFIARLPAPPYSFLDRIVSATVEPWQMKAGGSAIAEYDVPPAAWYFAAARQPRMPYAVLLEVALQACGWVSAFIGSALQSDDDLHYRNLGGRGTVLQVVGPETGTLSTTVKLSKVSKSAGMIIQHFDFAVRDSAGRDVYVGDTYFGFFTAAALRDQVGLREARPFDAKAIGEPIAYPPSAPFPDSQLRMVDQIDLWTPDGGPNGLGFIRGSKTVNPAEWFFQAHFHQDPVWPGSLGLEAFQQLLQFAASERWGRPTAWESPATGIAHEWVYRGQVTPNDRRVTVQAEITRIDEASQSLLAHGWLLVDDRVIYQMKDFSFRHTM